LLTDITVAIDKLDKIGLEGVNKELVQRGLSEEKINFITGYLNIKGETEAQLQEMATLLASSGMAQKGIQELRDTLAYHEQLKNESWNSNVAVDFTLARGLNYYTGIIAEVVTDAVKMGSIGGGGRYDDLTGLFGLKGLSGVGISFGVDRIFDVIEELSIFPEELASSTRVIFVNIEPKAELQIFSYLKKLREAGIAAEYYPDAAKFDKQMKYANKRNIPFVGIVGEAEMNDNIINLKNMISGEQAKVSISELIEVL
jgi:histidyl-tRNA synthetase